MCVTYSMYAGMYSSYYAMFPLGTLGDDDKDQPHGQDGWQS